MRAAVCLCARKKHGFGVDKPNEVVIYAATDSAAVQTERIPIVDEFVSMYYDLVRLPMNRQRRRP